jgi:hypothetical protein
MCTNQLIIAFVSLSTEDIQVGPTSQVYESMTHKQITSQVYTNTLAGI